MILVKFKHLHQSLIGQTGKKINKKSDLYDTIDKFVLIDIHSALHQMKKTNTHCFQVYLDYLQK